MNVLFDIVFYGGMICVINILLNREKGVAFVNVMLAILIPCLVAAVRPEDIGTDVMVYARPIFERALSVSKLSELMFQYSYTDLGYLLLAFCTAKITNSFSCFLFFTQLLVIWPVTISIYQVFNKRERTIACIVFYCVFFGMSMNIMRQSISAAWILFAFVNWREKKIGRMSISIIIGTLFHSSAILGIVMIVLPQLIALRKKKIEKVVYIICTTLAIAFLLTNIWEFMKILFDWIPVLEKYEIYLSRFLSDNNGSDYLRGVDRTVHFDMLWKAMLCILPFVLSNKTNNQHVELRQQTFYITIFSLATYIILTFFFDTSYSYRMTIYTDYFIFLHCGACAMGKQSNIEKYKWSISLRNTMIGLIASAGSIIIYLIWGWHEVRGLSTMLLEKLL